MQLNAVKSQYDGQSPINSQYETIYAVNFQYVLQTAMRYKDDNKFLFAVIH